MLGVGSVVDLLKLERGDISGQAFGRNLAFGFAGVFGGPPGAIISTGYGLIDNFYPGGADKFLDNPAPIPQARGFLPY